MECYLRLSVLGAKRVIQLNHIFPVLESISLLHRTAKWEALFSTSHSVYNELFNFLDFCKIPAA